MRRPRLNALRTFEAAGRNLSFSRAACELHITQAAVSQQIRHLEAYLDDALFIRSHRRIELTGKGRIYLETVTRALKELDSVTDKLFRTRPEKVVTIQCTSSIATLWLAPQIHAFKAQNPGIDLHIRTLEQGGETGSLGRADLEIFVASKTPDDSETTLLMTATISPVAAPGLLGATPPKHACDLLGCNLIHVLGYDDDWHRWFATFDPKIRQIPDGLSADSSLFAIDAVLRGEGIYLGRQPFINSHLKAGRLVEVFDQPHHLNANYYLRQKKTGPNIRNTKKVAQWLQQIIANPAA